MDVQSTCSSPPQSPAPEGDAEQQRSGIDVKSLALNAATHSTAPSAMLCSNRRQTKGRFLKGPVPLPWLQSAAKLPGKAFQVGAALWYRAGMECKSTITLTNILLGEFGVNRYAKRRALQQLERAGLISVSRKRGRNPLVTIVQVSQ
jgi:hypothetical protein